MPTELTLKIIAVIKKIPKGKVATYGLIAALAGNPRAAHQVVRILNIYWEKEKLPWHRIIGSQGKISLKPGQGYELQKSMLEKEGIVFDIRGRVDFESFLWQPKIKS
jgi:methylated-DNA-protein-cysteine methyltransferase-like protein